MNQSVIVKDVTLANLVAKAEGVLGRKLETMEHAMVEYAVEQIRLGVANLGVNQ